MKNILVLGGTRFLGRKLVEQLVEEGHRVTILTRGQSGNPFGDNVEHIVADRLNRTELSRRTKKRHFDIAYDNICYSSREAYTFCEVFNDKIGKLVFTSSLATYQADGTEKIETDFDPYRHGIHMGDRAEFTYGEGKRQAEAVFFKHAIVPVVAVRFPIIMGVDDHTRRLHVHVERILEEKPIGFINPEAEMSFIQAAEAARFLKWAGLQRVEGPYNATANGRIAMVDLIKIIEDVTGKQAKLVIDEKDDKSSPYSIPASWYMSNEKAAKKGFDFTNLHDWLEPLIVDIATDRGRLA